jgi:hypothetical protein
MYRVSVTSHQLLTGHNMQHMAPVCVALVQLCSAFDAVPHSIQGLNMYLVWCAAACNCVNWRM